MTASVIDMKTRKPVPVVTLVVPSPEVVTDDAQRVEKFSLLCEDSIWANALKLRAMNGLDRALRALHRVADELRNAGNPNYQPPEKV